MIDLQRERSRAMLEASINVIPSCFKSFLRTSLHRGYLRCVVNSYVGRYCHPVLIVLCIHLLQLLSSSIGRVVCWALLSSCHRRVVYSLCWTLLSSCHRRVVYSLCWTLLSSCPYRAVYPSVAVTVIQYPACCLFIC